MNTKHIDEDGCECKYETRLAGIAGGHIPSIFKVKGGLRQRFNLDLGKFPTQQDAIWAAKEWLQMRFGGEHPLETARSYECRLIREKVAAVRFGGGK